MPAKKHHHSLDATPELGFQGLKKILKTREYLREHCEFLAPVLKETIEHTIKAVTPFRRSMTKKGYLGLPRKPKKEQAHLEAKLERAMFQRWSLHDASPECGWHRIIDFQVPVKDRLRSPLSLKAIDLLGIDIRGMPVIIELKIVRERNGTKAADTPLLALLEAVAYACIIQSDWPCFKIELESKCNQLGIRAPFPDSLTPLPLIVAGPPEYWDFWNYEARSSIIEAKPAFRTLVDAFQREGFPVSFVCVEGSHADPQALTARTARFLEA